MTEFLLKNNVKQQKEKEKKKKKKCFGLLGEGGRSESAELVTLILRKLQ
jgi:hypothetical protein